MKGLNISLYPNAFVLLHKSSYHRVGRLSSAPRWLDRLCSRRLIPGPVFLFQLNSCKDRKAFVEFLSALGWPVDLASHPGWDGNIQRAWNRGKDEDETTTLCDSEADSHQTSSMSTITESGSDTEQDSTDGITIQCENSTTRSEPEAKTCSTDNPDTRETDQILYFADVSGEVAFIVPALLPRFRRSRRMATRGESSDEELADSHHVVTRETRSGSVGTLGSSSASSIDSKHSLPRQASSDSPASSDGHRTWSVDSRPLAKLSPHNTSSETNVVIAWLDQFEDHAFFPVDDVLAEFEFTRESRAGLGTTSLLEKETVVIFIHPLRSGLYRIHTRATIRSVHKFSLH